MNTPAITQDDIEALRRRTSKKMRLVTLIVLPGFAVFLVVAGLVNLYFCSRFADAAGMGMIEIIRQWFAGVDISSQYSGVHLKAIERWVTGISELAVGAVIGVMALLARRESKRSSRILEFLETKVI